MKEYRIAKGWAIFIYIFAPLLIGVFGYLLVMPFVPGLEDDIPMGVYWFLAPLSLGMIFLMVVALLDAAKAKVAFDNEKISSKSTFTNRELKFEEIKGFRINDRYIFIEPNIEGKKKIRISTYLGKTNEIKEWLASNYADLDIVNVEKDKQEILQNEEYGRTTEERIEKLNRARQISKILNLASSIVAAWTVFFAEPYEYAILASISIPMISIIALKFSNGLIRIDERKDSAYPSVLVAVCASSGGLFLRALLDFNIFDHANAWLLSILISVAIMVLIVIGNKELSFRKAKDYFIVFALSLVIWCYSYGAVIILNCYYDKSKPEIFNAKILDKRISSGKMTSYYLELTPWGKQTEIEEVSITKELYERLDMGDEVTIYFKKGQFEIPWFILTE